MSLAGIAIDAANRNPIVLLKDPAGRRQVPIWIDQSQAQSILKGLQQIAFRHSWSIYLNCSRVMSL